MTAVLPSAPQSIPTPYFSISARQRPVLLGIFGTLAAALLLFILLQPAPLTDTGCAVAIAIAALFPIYLWCAGIAKGMPIFPTLALAFIFSHALPFATSHPTVAEYLSEEKVYAALTTVIFLLVSTAVWFPFVRSAPLPPRQYRAFSLVSGETFFLATIAVKAIYEIAFHTGWVWQLGLSTGILSVVRTFAGISLLGSFVLCYRTGTGELSRSKRLWLVVLLSLNVIVQLAGLYLSPAFYTGAIAIAGYTIGSGRFPWRFTLVFVVLVLFLNLGKAEMREQYWRGEQGIDVRPWSYVPEWISYSWSRLQAPDTSPDLEVASEENNWWQDSFNRVSVIHQLLLIQSRTHALGQPHLNGLSYAIVPRMLVPRILNPNKIRTGEGNHLLTIYYGLGSYQHTLVVSIGWGLLQEAYANFGLFGSAGIAVFLGLTYGWVTRRCMHVPILAFPTLWAILFFDSALKSEWTMGLFCSVIFQGTVILLAIRTLLMRTYLHESYLSDRS